MTRISEADFNKALSVGRPPNIEQLFPNSRALLISGKYIDIAMLTKGQSICIAANGRNSFVIRGALRAAQRANSVLIVEIAKSEGGAKAYCDTNFWNMARTVDAFCNEMKITIPVAIHADHYGIKKAEDLQEAKVEIPTLFEAGMTSIALTGAAPREKLAGADRVVSGHAPIGLPIGSKTPPEIAISILAEITAERSNLRQDEPGTTRVQAVS